MKFKIDNNLVDYSKLSSFSFKLYNFDRKIQDKNFNIHFSYIKLYNIYFILLYLRPDGYNLFIDKHILFSF